MKYRGSQSNITLSSAGLGHISRRDLNVEGGDERILLGVFLIPLVYQDFFNIGLIYP